MNLTYRIERFFLNERGVVIKCEPVETDLKRDVNKNVPLFWKDHDGNLPKIVTFVNPIGEVNQRLTPLERVIIPGYDGMKSFILLYKDYSKGDQFP